MDDPYAEAAAAARADWVRDQERDEWEQETARRERGAFIAGYDAGWHYRNDRYYDAAQPDGSEAYERWRQGNA